MGEIQSSSDIRNSWKIQYFPRVFKLRYLCDYWELEAEIKTGERFRFVICISIRLDLLSWIVNQTGLSQGYPILIMTDLELDTIYGFSVTTLR